MLFDGSASEEITSDTSFFPVIKVSNDGHTAYLRSSGEAGSGEAELYSIPKGAFDGMTRESIEANMGNLSKKGLDLRV